MNLTKYRVTASVVVTVAAVALLTGCSSPAPRVAWVNPVAAEYADNRYVTALVEGLTQAAHAVNSGNFTFAELEASTTAEWRWSMYLDYIRDTSDEAWALPGPRPFDVVTIIEAADGRSADITVCAFRGDRSITAETPDPMEALERGLGFRLGEQESGGTYLYKVAEDSTGNLLVSEAELGAPFGKGGCDADGAAIGFFDPLPSPRIPGDVAGWNKPEKPDRP